MGLALLDDGSGEAPRDAAVVYDWDEDRLEAGFVHQDCMWNWFTHSKEKSDSEMCTSSET